MFSEFDLALIEKLKGLSAFIKIVDAVDFDKTTKEYSGHFVLILEENETEAVTQYALLFSSTDSAVFVEYSTMLLNSLTAEEYSRLTTYEYVDPDAEQSCETGDLEVF